MTAIITDKLKKTLANSIFDELQGTKIGDSDNYFSIAIGRSQQYDPVANNDTATTPTNTDREEKEFRYNMQSVKAVEAFSFAVPLHSWTSNTIYSAYSDNVVGQPATSYYVKTDDNNVYVCISTGKSAVGVTQVSTVKPDHTNSTLTKETDGYIWKYIYTITTAAANSFLTSEFMPVGYIDSAANTDPTYTQYLAQQAAVKGQIVGYRVTNSGGPYSSAPAITIAGNGTGAKARSILNTSGGIAAIEVGDSANAPIVSSLGQNYNYGTVSINATTLGAGGTTATAVPMMGPVDGLASNATNDLRSTNIMFNIKPSGDVSGKWITGNDYRQIALVKNLTEYDSSGKLTAAAGNALKKTTLTTQPGAGAISYAADVELLGATSGSKAWLDFYDDSNTLWWHQDEYTGFGDFTDGENITVEGYTASTLTVDSALQKPDLDIFSGDLLYIDNRATATTRDVGQTEDIKVVIKL